MGFDSTKEDLIKGINEYCKRLRLSKDFAQRAITNSDDRPDYLEYVCRLLKVEVSLRSQRSIDKNIEAAGFPCHFDSSDFDDKDLVFPSGMSMQSLMELSFCNAPVKGNVIIYGGPGVGKTMLSSILGEAAAKEGYKTLFCNTHDIVEVLFEAQDAGNLRSFLKRFEKVELLILDEFGYIPCSVEETRLLFRLMSMFFGKKSIILNTYVNISKWQEVFLEERLAACIAGKVMQNGIILKLGGLDRRINSHREGK